MQSLSLVIAGYPQMCLQLLQRGQTEIDSLSFTLAAASGVHAGIRGQEMTVNTVAVLISLGKTKLCLEVSEVLLKLKSRL